MADKDVTQEAAELNAAEQYLGDLPLRKEAEQQALVTLLAEVDNALRGMKVQFNLSVAMDKANEKAQILERTRDLLKRREAIQRLLEAKA